jgi:hypothetical protein
MPLKLDTRLPRWIRKTPATRTALALVLGLLAVPLLASPVAPQKDKPIKGAGVEVTVTPEMMGAGAVSSGVTLPPIPPVTGSRKNPVASWGKPLPYPILIADRRNNRLIEIAPDKSIVWEFPSPSLKVYRGNEDVNFSADGKLLAVSEEDNFDVHIVDYEKRQLTWTYGMPDRRGSGEGLLNYPDDAHLLADGKFLTADIRNCRVLIIDPGHQQDRHPVGHTRQVQTQSTPRTGPPQWRHAAGQWRHPGDRDQRRLDLAHHPRGQGVVERQGARHPLPVRRLPDRGRQAGHRRRLLEAGAAW